MPTSVRVFIQPANPLPLPPPPGGVRLRACLCKHSHGGEFRCHESSTNGSNRCCSGSPEAALTACGKEPGTNSAAKPCTAADWSKSPSDGGNGPSPSPGPASNTWTTDPIRRNSRAAKTPLPRRRLESSHPTWPRAKNPAARWLRSYRFSERAPFRGRRPRPSRSSSWRSSQKPAAASSNAKPAVGRPRSGRSVLPQHGGRERSLRPRSCTQVGAATDTKFGWSTPPPGAWPCCHPLPYRHGSLLHTPW